MHWLQEESPLPRRLAELPGCHPFSVVTCQLGTPQHAPQDSSLQCVGLPQKDTDIATVFSQRPAHEGSTSGGPHCCIWSLALSLADRAQCLFGE